MLHARCRNVVCGGCYELFLNSLEILMEGGLRENGVWKLDVRVALLLAVRIIVAFIYTYH